MADEIKQLKAKLAEATYLDFNALCCAANGDWVLELIDDDMKMPHEVYLNIIKGMADYRAKLSKEMYEIRKRLCAAESIIRKGARLAGDNGSDSDWSEVCFDCKDYVVSNYQSA